MRPDSDSPGISITRQGAPTDHGETQALERRTPPATFGQRHGLKVMATVMAMMFALVIVAQVAC